MLCHDLSCVEIDRLAAWIVIVIAKEFIISGFRLVASDNGIVIAAVTGANLNHFPDAYDHRIDLRFPESLFPDACNSTDLYCIDPNGRFSDRLHCKNKQVLKKEQK